MTFANLSTSATDDVPMFTKGGDIGLSGLGRLTDAIAQQASGVEAEPAAWSQLNLFEAAFHNQAHPAHGDAVSQWRGLIALLALSAAHASRYVVNVDAVRLFDGDGTDAVANALVRPSALSLLPGLAMDSTIAVLTLQNRTYAGPAGPRQPIGFVSSTTLVAPARTRPELALPGAAFLSADGLFTDPLAAADPHAFSTRHRAIVERYLRTLCEEAMFLANAADKSAEWRAAAGTLLHALVQFTEECSTPETSEIPLKSVRQIPRGWPGHHLLQAMDAAFVVAPSTSPLPAKVEVSETRETSVQSVILADAAIAETLDCAPGDVSLWAEWTLHDIAEGDAFAAACENALANETLLLRPRDLFTDEALRFENTVATAHGESLARWLLPFAPTVLFMLSAQELRERLEIEEGRTSRDGRFALFRLRVPLAVGLDHVIERFYSEFPENSGRGGGRLLTLEGEDEYNPPEVLALWPDFESAAWAHNFIYFQGNPQIDLMPLIGVSASMIARTLFQESEPSVRLRRLRTWSQPGGQELTAHFAQGVRTTIEHELQPHAPWFDRLRVHEEPRNVAEIQKLRAIEALIMTRPTDADGRRVCGLLMAAREPVKAPTRHDAAVAIDFGTTGTVVQLAKGETDHDAVLHQRLHHPARRLVQGGLAPSPTEAFGAFFPAADHATPMATVAQRRELHGPAAEIYGSNLGLDDLGFSDAPFFDDSLEGTLQAMQKGLLIYGLKWGPGKRPIAKRYLRQLILMVAAELFASGADPEKTAWRLSYPDAFSNLERSSFHRIAVKAALDEVFGPGAVEPRMHPESTAVVRHLTDPAYYPRSGAASPFISLDIGGGTTDVVYWAKNRVVWRSSFPMGGQSFLTDVIRQNISFIQDIIPGLPGVPQLIAMVNSLGDGDGESVDNTMGLVEMLLTSDQFRERFAKNYPLLWDSGPAMLLRISSTTLLCGILWYMGRVTRWLAEDGTVDQDIANTVRFVLAGRGCQMFRLFHDDANHQSYLSELGSMFLHGAGSPVDTLAPERIEISGQLKREVVLGMLRQARAGALADANEVREAARAHHTFMPLLANVAINVGEESMAFPPGTPVRALIQGGSLRRGAQVTVDLFDEFYAFLDALYASSGVRVDFTSGHENIWLGQVQDTLHHAIMTAPPRTSEQDSHYIEPPFVAGLRILLNWIAKSKFDGRDPLSFHIA